MAIQGFNPLSHANANASTSVSKRDAVNTPRPQEIQVRPSSQSLAPSDRARGGAVRSESTKATGAMRNRAAALAAKFERSEGSMLQLFSEQMDLEGEFLKVYPSMPYEEVLGNLHEGLQGLRGESLEPEQISASRTRMQDALVAFGAQQGVPNAGALNVALATYAQSLVDSLEISHHRFEEVLKDPSLTADQKSNIERSRNAFVDYAIRVGTEIPRVLAGCKNTTGHRLDQLEKQIADSKIHLDTLPQGKERDAANVAHEVLEKKGTDWKAAHDLLTTIESNYKSPAALADAIHNVRLPTILAEFDKQRSYMNIARSVTPAAVAQGIASSLHFGATRSSIERAMSTHNYATRVSATGTGLGVVHEVVNNSVRPVSQELMGSLGGKGVRPVKATEVIPNPTRFITVNGVPLKRTDEEWSAAKTAVSKLKADFALAQNKHKFGTAQGEMAGFGSFGAAQTVLEGLVAADILPQKTIPALMLTSAAGGFFMVGTQTLNQLTTTVKDQQGRILPTHVPKDVEGTLAQRLGKVGKDGLNAVDFRESAVQEAFLSKIFGAIQGVGVSTYAADQVRDMKRDSPAHIASKLIVSGFGPTMMLSSFFAAMQTKPEATKGGTGRLDNARANLLEPDRGTLPHTTQPGSTARVAENTFNRLRGFLQLPSQAAVDMVSPIAQLGTNAASAVGQTLGNAATAVSQSLRNTLRGNVEADIDLERGEGGASREPS